jgi:BioD-like phosphotransacetylase family protein
MTARGLVIAAPASGSGKTTITTGLITAFAARGRKPARTISILVFTRPRARARA